MIAQPRLSNLCILIVDDEPDNLKLLYTILTFYGAVALRAKDGKQAMEMLSNCRPDLVLTDLSMPEMNGWELLTAIRADPDLSELPVMAITAHASASDKEQGTLAGFDAYLTKPLSLDNLVQEILEKVPTLNVLVEIRDF